MRDVRGAVFTAIVQALGEPKGGQPMTENLRLWEDFDDVDSLSWLELEIELEDIFVGEDFADDAAFDDLKTVGDVVRFVEQKLSTRVH